MIETGVYLHHKGGLYLVSSVAKHSETGEEFVIYHDMQNACYARPASMFSDVVTLEDGKQVPRFAMIRRVIHHGMSCSDIIEEGKTRAIESALEKQSANESWWDKCLVYLGFEVKKTG